MVVGGGRRGQRVEKAMGERSERGQSCAGFGSQSEDLYSGVVVVW